MRHREAYLHYIWRYGLYDQLIPTGELAGARIEVLEPGELNTDAGPDFFAAKIRINDLLWVGCVEIHHASAEWYHHHHDSDPAYHSVILHVVEQDNRPIALASGASLPTCLLMVPHQLEGEDAPRECSPTALPCTQSTTRGGGLAPLGQLPHKARRAWLQCLLHSRLREKVQALEDLLQRCGGDWGQTFYTLLLRYYGFGLNSESMERLALSLPYTTLMKHRDHPEQVEALLVGQAGLLGYLAEGEHTELLRSEYHFLSHKYTLSPLPPGTFRRARTRPSNLPERRLLQLAGLLCQRESLAEESLRVDSLTEAYELLRPSREARREEGEVGTSSVLSPASCELLIINVLIPYRLTWRRHYGGEGEEYAPLSLLDGLSAESNRITRLFASAGLPVETASDSQALLYLHRHYCSQQLCSCCPWGTRPSESTT